MVCWPSDSNGDGDGGLHVFDILFCQHLNYFDLRHRLAHSLDIGKNDLLTNCSSLYPQLFFAKTIRLYLLWVLHFINYPKGIFSIN